MRYLILSNNQYEEARIISNLSNLGHTWVPLDQANASITHIIVHPDLVDLSPHQKKRVAGLKAKCRAHVVPSSSVMDLNADTRLCHLAQQGHSHEQHQQSYRAEVSKQLVDQQQKPQSNNGPRDVNDDEPQSTAPIYGITVVSSRKSVNVDPDDTYMAPRQWIKMLPNDDCHHAWAGQTGSGMLKESAKHQKSPSPRTASSHPPSHHHDHHHHHERAHASFKQAVEKVIMANSFGNSFRHTREKRLGKNPFHEKFKNRKKLTQFDTPDALNRRLLDLEESIVTKRQAEIEEARLAQELKAQERKEAKLQTRRQAVGHFQAPATKLAMRLAGRLRKGTSLSTPPGAASVQHTTQSIGCILGERQISRIHSQESKRIGNQPASSKTGKGHDLSTRSPDPLTRWRAKTKQHRAEMAEEEHSVNSVDPTKISFSTAATAIEALAKERRAKLEGGKSAGGPNLFLERLKEAKGAHVSGHSNSVSSLRAAAKEACSVHSEVPKWSELRGEVSRPPIVIKATPSRPRTAPSRVNSKDLSPLRHNQSTSSLSNPPTDRQSARESEEKANTIALIQESILLGCSPVVHTTAIPLIT